MAIQSMRFIIMILTAQNIEIPFLFKKFFDLFQKCVFSFTLFEFLFLTKKCKLDYKILFRPGYCKVSTFCVRSGPVASHSILKTESRNSNFGSKNFKIITIAYGWFSQCFKYLKEHSYDDLCSHILAQNFYIVVCI